MARLLILYNKPADTAAFDAYYSGRHLPLAYKIPGLRSLLTSAEPPRALAGSAPYLITELNFDSLDDLNAGLASPEGRAAAGDLANFADGGATILAYECVERGSGEESAHRLSQAVDSLSGILP